MPACFYETSTTGNGSLKIIFLYNCTELSKRYVQHNGTGSIGRDQGEEGSATNVKDNQNILFQIAKQSNVPTDEWIHFLGGLDLDKNEKKDI